MALGLHPHLLPQFFDLARILSFSCRAITPLLPPRVSGQSLPLDSVIIYNIDLS